MLLTNSQDYDNNKNIGNVFFFVLADIFFYRYTRKRADAQYYVLVHIHWNHNTFLNNNNVVGDHAPCMHNMAEHVTARPTLTTRTTCHTMTQHGTHAQHVTNAQTEQTLHHATTWHSIHHLTHYDNMIQGDTASAQ